MVASSDVKGEVGNWDKGFRYSKECINSKNKWGGRSGHEGGPPPCNQLISGRMWSIIFEYLAVKACSVYLGLYKFSLIE